MAMASIRVHYMHRRSAVFDTLWKCGSKLYRILYGEPRIDVTKEASTDSNSEPFNGKMRSTNKESYTHVSIRWLPVKQSSNCLETCLSDKQLLFRGLHLQHHPTTHHLHTYHESTTAPTPTMMWQASQVTTLTRWVLTSATMDASM
jgi:hypothetical protein